MFFSDFFKKKTKATVDNEISDVLSESVSLEELKERIANTNFVCHAIEQAKELGTDLLEMTEHSPTCAECAKFQGRVYSISGKSKKFPPLPKSFVEIGGVHEGCRHNFYPYFDGISTPTYHEDIVEYSNSPFVDNRSPEEVAEYEAEQKKIADKNRDSDEYQLILQKLPDIAPKSFGGYRRMKNAKSKNYQALKEKCEEVGIRIEE